MEFDLIKSPLTTSSALSTLRCLADTMFRIEVENGVI